MRRYIYYSTKSGFLQLSGRRGSVRVPVHKPACGRHMLLRGGDADADGAQGVSADRHTGFGGGVSAADGCGAADRLARSCFPNACGDARSHRELADRSCGGETLPETGSAARGAVGAAADGALVRGGGSDYEKTAWFAAFRDFCSGWNARRNPRREHAGTAALPQAAPDSGGTFRSAASD